MLAVAATIAVVVLGAQPAAAADVYGDDEADRYVGTGGLILPGTVDPGTRREVAGCPGCRWRLSTPCLLSGAGTPFDGQPVCQSVVRGCGNGQQLLRAWFARDGSWWREIGLVCIGPSGPFTVAEARRRARSMFVRDLPVPAAARQPDRGIVTQIPVVFRSGQPAGPLRADYPIAGEVVHLVAEPSWRWDFGDGATLTTASPGAGYPDLSLSHTYRQAGRYAVTVATIWSAEFTVAGLGPYEIAEPVRQSAGVDVAVGEGRAVLTVR